MYIENADLLDDIMRAIVASYFHGYTKLSPFKRMLLTRSSLNGKFKAANRAEVRVEIPNYITIDVYL